MDVLDWIFYCVIGFLCLFNCWLLWRTRRLYSGNMAQALRLTARGALHSEYFIGAAGVAVIVFTLFGVLSWLNGIFIKELFVLLLGGLFSMIIIYIRPPAAVILASSHSDSARVVLKGIRSRCRGHRVIYFLKPRNIEASEDDSLEGQFLSNETRDNLYQFDDYTWKFIVFPLLKCVPIIIIDAWTKSGGLSDELEFIGSNASLLKKTVVYGHEALESELSGYGPSFRVATSLGELEWIVTSLIESAYKQNASTFTKSDREKCKSCGKIMIMLSGKIMTQETMIKALGSFRCLSCRRLTCWECSDNRKSCQCGAKNWREELYFDSTPSSRS